MLGQEVDSLAELMMQQWREGRSPSLWGPGPAHSAHSTEAASSCQAALKVQVQALPRTIWTALHPNLQPKFSLLCNKAGSTGSP